MMRLPTAVLPVLLAVTCAATAQRVPAGPPRDPFVVPLLKPLAGFGGAGVPAAAVSRPPEPRWNPPLHGLMVAGPRSMANVGGVLLGLGQSVDGYRLVAVRETEAEFTRHGQHFVLRMPQEQEVDPR